MGTELQAANPEAQGASMLTPTQQRMIKRHILYAYNYTFRMCLMNNVLSGIVDKEDHPGYILTFVRLKDGIPQYHEYWSMYDEEYKKLLNRR